MARFQDVTRPSGCSLQNFEEDFNDIHLIHAVLGKWAKEKPDAIAIINADTGEKISWSYFDIITTALAMKLIEMGFRKGDFLATLLPFLTEHIILEYACFKIGVIHIPLDFRLKYQDVIRNLELTKAKGFVFMDSTQKTDIQDIGKAVMANCPRVEKFIHFSQNDETVNGAESYFKIYVDAQKLSLHAEIAENHSDIFSTYLKMNSLVDENDATIVVFTTGSTGPSKPALLSHCNITCQNMCLGAAFGLGENTKSLINLPPSHVGGQTVQLMTTLFLGGTAILLPYFSASRSLQAVQRYKVNVLGQIPAMFNLEWLLPNYSDYDLSSLKLVIHSGQQVTPRFVEKLSTMAPRLGTGLSLTEAAGFCTYTSLIGTKGDNLLSLGYDMPIYRLSIRKPMKNNCLAGEELLNGETGCICFEGLQTFLGYVNDAKATSEAISQDAILYTGDIGYRDGMGLHITGRAKCVIKPKGFQVYPSQVEDFIRKFEEKVSACAVLGFEHELFSEAILAFVEKRQDADLTIKELEEHAKGLASFMRPLHYVLLEQNQLPLNQLGKTDYMRLQTMAKEEIEKIRLNGGWDRLHKECQA